MLRDLRIDIRDLKQANVKTYHFTLGESWLTGAFEGCDFVARSLPEQASAGPKPEPSHVTVEAQFTGRDVLIRGHVSIWLEFACARCLKPVPYAASAELVGLFSPAPIAGHKSDDDAPPDEEAGVYSFSDNVIFLDELAREQVLLEIPMAPVCTDDCPGVEANAARTSVPPPPDAAAAHPLPKVSQVGHVRSGSPARREHAMDPRLAPLLDLAKKMPKQS